MTLSHQTTLKQRYKIKDTLGEGGFGAAYLATDVVSWRDCVVKRLKTSRDVSDKQTALLQANFEREANLLATLNQPGHHNIPELYDYFQESGDAYIVMQYIEGQSLKRLLEQAGAIAWREAVSYIAEVCDAVHYMHTHEIGPILHCGIKPDDIILDNANKIWLVDFGLSKHYPSEGVGDKMAAGTLGYTPLEQWQEKAVPASDIYALGVTLHYLVTNVNPAQMYGPSFDVISLKKHHGSLKPIRKISRKLPRRLEQIITSATAADSEQRPTALEFQYQLEALLSNEPMGLRKVLKTLKLYLGL